MYNDRLQQGLTGASTPGYDQRAQTATIQTAKQESRPASNVQAAIGLLFDAN